MFTVLDSPGSSGMIIVIRKHLYDLMREQKLSSLEEKLDFLENHLLSSYAHFKIIMQQKWSKAQRKKDFFS